MKKHKPQATDKFIGINLSERLLKNWPSSAHKLIIYATNFVNTKTTNRVPSKPKKKKDTSNDSAALVANILTENTPLESSGQCV